MVTVSGKMPKTLSYFKWWQKMKKYKAAVAATLMLAAGAANAISMDVQAGKKYTDINIGVGDPYSGLSFDGNWARSDHQGQLGGARAKFAFPLGPVSASVGGKAIYLDRKWVKKEWLSHRVLVWHGAFCRQSAFTVNFTAHRQV